MEKLCDIELADEHALLALKNEVNFQNPFGISSIQRRLRFGYNRAARLTERLLEKGCIERPAEKEWMFQFTKKE